MMVMADRGRHAGRAGAKRAIAATGLALSIGAMLLATEIPSAVSSVGGGSVALAELLARSPGARIGGVALKAKTRRAALAAAPSGPADLAPGKEQTALAAGAPEGPIPGFLAPGGTPTDIFAPPVPGLAFASSGSGPSFAALPPPAIGGGGIFIGGGGGSGGGGGGGGGTGTVPSGPTPTLTTPPTPTPTGTVPTPVAPVPEPATWLMMIAGFGAVGTAMRRRRRAVLA